MVNDYGAELWSLYDKRQQKERLWQGEASVWPRRAPILFPTVGILRDGYCTVKGVRYEIPQHGFARDFVHTLVACDSDHIELELKSNEQTKRMYPFSFSFRSVFQLEGETLVQEFRIKNTGDEPMPFMVGFHTGYRLFASSGSYELILKNQKEGLRETRRLDPHSDGSTAKMIPCPYDSVTLHSAHDSLTVSMEKDYNLMLWAPAGRREVVCIEPWQGRADVQDTTHELQDKPGEVLLQPNSTCIFKQKITID